MKHLQFDSNESTVEALRDFANIMEQGKVKVELHPQFLREVADELADAQTSRITIHGNDGVLCEFIGTEADRIYSMAIQHLITTALENLIENGYDTGYDL